MTDEAPKVRSIQHMELMLDQYITMLQAKIIDGTITNAEQDRFVAMVREAGLRVVNTPGTPTAKLLASIETTSEPTQHLPFPILKQNIQG